MSTLKYKVIPKEANFDLIYHYKKKKNRRREYDPIEEDDCTPKEAMVDLLHHHKKKKRRREVDPFEEDDCTPKETMVDLLHHHKKKKRRREIDPFEEDDCTPKETMVDLLHHHKKKKRRQEIDLFEEDDCTPKETMVDLLHHHKKKKRRREIDPFEEDECTPKEAKLDMLHHHKKKKKRIRGNDPFKRDNREQQREDKRKRKPEGGPRENHVASDIVRDSQSESVSCQSGEGQLALKKKTKSLGSKTLHEEEFNARISNDSKLDIVDSLQTECSENSSAHRSTPKTKLKRRHSCPREPSISCEEDVYQDTSESAGTVHRKRTKTKKKDKRLADSPPGKLSQSLTATSFHQKRYNQLMEEMENFAGRMGDENSSQSSSSVDEEDDEIAELHRVWHIKELKDTRDRGLISQWKVGRWSLQEVEKLKRNVMKFMKLHGVEDICSIIIDKRKEDYPELYRFLARGIRRPLFLVYRKVNSMFNPENYNGQWTSEQDKELLRLQRIHGSDWKAMGLSLGVTHQVVRDRFRQITGTAIRKGQWNHEEEERLKQAMKYFHQRYPAQGEDSAEEMGGQERVWRYKLPTEVTWDQVAARVKTRTALQCRHKWVLGRSWLLQETGEKWGAADNAHLLCRLRDLEADCEEEVDWTTLAQGWQNARSSSFLRFKWALLKRSVPGYLWMTYHECLWYLLKHRLPAFSQQLHQPAIADSQIIVQS